MTPREEINFYITIGTTVRENFPDYQGRKDFWPSSEEAIDLLSRYIVISPENVEAYLLRAWNYEHTKEYTKADSDYTTALILAPNRFDVLICCWLPLLFKLKWFQKAISILIDRLQTEIEPYRIAYIHLRIALVYYKMEYLRLFELHIRLSEQFKLIARSEIRTLDS